MPTTNAPLNDDLWLREMPEPLAELYEQLCSSTPDQRFERLRKLGEIAVHFATIIALANAATGSAIPVEYSSWVRALVPLNIGNSLRILGEALRKSSCSATHGASECRGLVGKLPTGATTTWTLKCGGEQRWYAVDGAWLLVYMPAGEADCEWWLYPHDASADKLEREIADAYSCNDAATLAWEGKRPEEALKLYESAVQILSIYSKAACRGCAVSRFLGREDAKLCATGAKSNNSSTKKKSKGREQLPKLGATLCP